MLSEPKTINGFKKGDQKSLAYIFNLYHKALFTFADDLIGDAQAAQDIVADSFVKIWESRGQFDHIANIRAYLFTVVRNACFGYLKKSKREEIAKKEISYLTDITVSEEEMLHAEIYSDLMDLVSEEVEKLPKKSRVIIKMMLYENLTIAEIAERLSLNTKTVYNQKNRALKLLQIAIFKRRLAVLFWGFMAKYFI